MSPELSQLIAQLNKLSNSERSQLLMGLQAVQKGSLSQSNSDKSNGWQIHMEDGILNCGNNTILNCKIPEELIQNLVDALSGQIRENLIISESDYYTENRNTIDLEYDSENIYTSNYYNPSGNTIYENLTSYSFIPRLLMGGGLILCAGIALVGKINQTAIRVAIVQPETGKNAAYLRTQPNAGSIKGYVMKGKEVQVIQCIQDGCEVNDGSIQGWIYKPFLRFK